MRAESGPSDPPRPSGGPSWWRALKAMATVVVVAVVLLTSLGPCVDPDCHARCEANGGLQSQKTRAHMQGRIYECHCSDGVTHEVDPSFWFVEWFRRKG